MSRNKILSAAIVAALSMGVGTAQASIFKLVQNDTPTTDLSENDKPKYAYEQFPISGTNKLTFPYRVRYTTGKRVKGDINVTFTLSQGTWAKSVVTANLTIYDDKGVEKTDTEITKARVGNGETNESSVKFLIGSGSTNAALEENYVLDFKFEIGGVAGVLSTSGTTIKLDVVLAFAGTSSGSIPDDPKSLQIASSGEGILIYPERGPMNTFIDVARGSTVFENGNPDDTSVQLGKITMSYPTLKLKQEDGKAPFEFKGESSGGTLTIKEGIFAASMGSTGAVYLELGDIKTGYNAPTASSTGDLKANNVTADEATWNLTAQQLEDMVGKTVPIMVKVDGTTLINSHANPPSLVFTIKFQKDVITTEKLSHIKRNGKVCKSYQVPNPDATDALSIRITNKTAKSGVVLGTLTGMDGKAIFTNQTLIEALEPQNTVRLGTTQLVEKLPEGTTTWQGRATLTISSDLTDMEVFTLLRNKLGGPLMNMSDVSTGNACD